MLVSTELVKENVMTTYFECHVTMTGDPATIRPLVEALKWKFSSIDGDIVLGDGVKCYATRLFNARIDSADVFEALNSAAACLLNAGCNVIRRKMERVLYDDRSTKTQCTGGCAGCHLDDFRRADECSNCGQTLSCETCDT